jgi:hypothetical protein
MTPGAGSVTLNWMQRVLASGLVAVGLALLVPSCAEGDANPSGDVSALTNDATAGPSGEECSACPAGEKCSAGACAPLTSDADGDGTTLATDCDDHDRAVRPGAPEVCNGRDDNCNGKVDETFDADGDGVPTCAALGKAADCDDKDPAVRPGGLELCNGKDDNCDGKIDETFDKDNDGFFTCVRGEVAADCNDADPLIHPGATETCNGKDDDCNTKNDDLPATLMGTLSAPVDAHWKVAGSALFANGWAQLTQDVAYQAGALWWNASYAFDTFDMSATFWIQAKAAGADGFSFAWIAGNNLNVGGHGNSYGVVGLPGYAVVIDTSPNAGEPSTPHLAIIDAANLTTPALGRYMIPNVRDAQNHRLRVTLDAGKVSVWIDGVNYVSNLALPSATPFAGHWGFTGATGGNSEAHWVTDVSMKFPNGQGCVP